MPDSQLIDPYRAYNFKLIMQPDLTEGHFTEISGLGISVPVITYREGGVQQVLRKLPGYVEYADVTMRYGVTRSRELFDWMLTAVSGRVQRRTVSIVMLDPDGSSEVLRWNLTRAWPTEWRGSVLNAMLREVAIESLTLAFEELERA